MRTMADWLELRPELLVLIVRRINLIKDYLNFRMFANRGTL